MLFLWFRGRFARPAQSSLRSKRAYPTTDLVTSSRWVRPAATLLIMLLVLPVAVLAQQGGSPFDSGLTSIQTLFTGTIAKVASLVAIVIGGYSFAHGEPGAKRTLAGVAAGTGIAVLAVNVLSWLWGV